MLKAYRYKLEPNKSQRYALARTLDVCRELYNDCLYQRKLQQISRYEQSAQLTQLKAEFPVHKNVYSQVLQHVLGRVDRAFKNFLRSGFGFPRRRAVLLLQKVHQGISNRRSDFLHKHSTAVIRKYGTVKVEGLNVSGMSRGNLAKQILDCSWSEWFRQLRYKAEEAGRRFVAVDPKYTSQICSECGFKHPDNRKTQADFVCLSCGHQDNADHNAAVNILARNEPLDANVSGVTLCVV